MSPLTDLPLARPTGCPFDPPAELGEIRDQEPVVRMTYPDGHEGWLVTGYAEGRGGHAVRRHPIRHQGNGGLRPGRPDLDAAGAGEMTGPDNTAVRVALLRAIHVDFDQPPHVFVDKIGLELADPDDNWRRRADMDPKATAGFRGSVIGRARFVEDLVAGHAWPSGSGPTTPIREATRESEQPDASFVQPHHHSVAQPRGIRALAPLRLPRRLRADHPAVSVNR